MATHSDSSINPKSTPPSQVPSIKPKPSRLELSLVALMMASCSGFFYFHPATLYAFFGQVDSGKFYQLFAYLVFFMLFVWGFGYIRRVPKTSAFVIGSAFIVLCLIFYGSLSIGMFALALPFAFVIPLIGFIAESAAIMNATAWFIPLLILQCLLLLFWFVPRQPSAKRLNRWRTVVLLLTLSVPVYLAYTDPYFHPGRVQDEMVFNNRYYYLVLTPSIFDDDDVNSQIYECNLDGLDCNQVGSYWDEQYEQPANELRIDVPNKLVYLVIGNEVRVSYKSGTIEQPIRPIFRLAAGLCEQGIQSLC